MLISVEVLALIVASEYSLSISIVHLSSISLDEFGFLAKKIVTKVWTQRLSADPKYGFFDGLFVLEFRAINNNKSSKDQITHQFD